MIVKGEKLLAFIDKNIAINKAIGKVGGIDLEELRTELLELIENDKIGRATKTAFAFGATMRVDSNLYEDTDFEEIFEVRQLLNWAEKE